MGMDDDEGHNPDANSGLPVNATVIITPTPTTASSTRSRRPPPSLTPPPAATGTTTKFLAMARRRSFWKTTLLISLITVAALGTLAPVFAPLPPSSSSLSSVSDLNHYEKRVIHKDMVPLLLQALKRVSVVFFWLLFNLKEKKSDLGHNSVVIRVIVLGLR